MEYISVGRRAVAIIVDTVLLLFVSIVIIAITGDVGTVTTTDTSFEFEASGGGLSTALVVIASFAYFIVLEAVMGATLGKLLVGIRVVMLDGSDVTWAASVIRNLFRVIDGFFLYLVGAIIVWNSAKRQRLGDQVARTVVVAKSSLGVQPSARPPGVPPAPLPPIPPG